MDPDRHEGGFLPAPVVIPPQPVDWNRDTGDLRFRQRQHLFSLSRLGRAGGRDRRFLASLPARRSSFTTTPPRRSRPLTRATTTYTGGPDQTDIGGAPATPVGYGPNTRTIMQIRVTSGYRRLRTTSRL